MSSDPNSGVAIDLATTRAVVTGSTRGLGEAIARDLAARGAAVVVNGTYRERCEAIAEQIGGRAVAGSVAEESTADELIAACCESFDGIDLLVNNAGVTRDGMLHQIAPEGFDEVIAVDLRGAWLASRAAAAVMRKSGGGAIVNVSSGTRPVWQPGAEQLRGRRGRDLGADPRPLA